MPWTVHRPSRRSLSGVGVELMAGSQRIASSLAAAGLESVSLELADSAEEDALGGKFSSWMKAMLAASLLRVVWIGLVCATWSRARRNTSGKKGWPPPLRSDSQLWGLSNLSTLDAERVAVGNRQARWALRVLLKCARSGCEAVIENPAGSRV